MRIATLLLALTLATAAAAPASADVTGPEIVGHLNAQRAAHGIPAGIAEDPALSDGCAKHNAYGRINGVLTHFEDPDLEGYTPEGDQAGRTSVLYRGGPSWAAGRNPFETAPIHLHQLLAPRIDRMGASEDQGYGCATTLASRNRAPAAADATFTYPGDGATGWPASQTARESPYTPGERVGIPAGTETGPYLYVMFDGPDLSTFDIATATGATLTGPDGPVDVAVADNTTSGLEGFLPTGLEVIPRRPLRPRATYTASVSASVTSEGRMGPSRPFQHTWSFTTGQLENAIRITRTEVRNRRVEVFVESRAPGATVEATGPGRTASAPVDAGGKATFDLDADGMWRFCARSGGPEADHVAAEDCVSQSVTSPSEDPAPVQPQDPPRRNPPPAVVIPPPVRVDDPFSVSVPKRVRRGRAFKLAITAPKTFRLSWKLTTRGGETVLRFKPRTLAPTTWTFRVRPPKALRRKGSRLKLKLVVRTGGRRYAVSRTVRYR